MKKPQNIQSVKFQIVENILPISICEIYVIGVVDILELGKIKFKDIKLNKG
jgi:hypothetical protein